MISRSVHPQEFGKIFAIMSSTESVVPMIGSAIYSEVYLATVEGKLPGAVYLMSAAILVVPLFMTM